jgi:hypothetical protein
MTLEVIPRERRNVEKAVLWSAVSAIAGDGWVPTVDFVLHPLAIAHR